MKLISKKSMSIIGLFLWTLGFQSATAQNLKLSAQSPKQVLQEEFGLSHIKLVYHRPLARNREIFGALVPFGEIWRTGANESTKIEFGEDVVIDEKIIPAGEYSLYTIPNEKKWTIILNKNLKNWGASNYNANEDVVRFEVEANKTENYTEAFTILITKHQQESINLQLFWANTVIGFNIKPHELDEKSMKNIAENINGKQPNYFTAAFYYLENNKDLNQALTWINKAIEEKPEAFWIMTNKARIQLKLNDKKGALETAEKAKALAEKAKNQDYVKINEHLIDQIKN